MILSDWPQVSTDPAGVHGNNGTALSADFADLRRLRQSFCNRKILALPSELLKAA